YPVHPDVHGIAAASDVVSVPLAGRFFRTGKTAWQTLGLGIDERGKARATIEPQFTGVAREELRFETQRPDLVGWIEMEKDAAVARTCRPAPFDVQPIISIGLQGSGIAVRPAEADDRAIGHRPNGR